MRSDEHSGRNCRKILPVANFAPLLLSSPFVAGSDEDEAGDVLVKSEKIPTVAVPRLGYITSDIGLLMNQP